MKAQRSFSFAKAHQDQVAKSGRDLKPPTTRNKLPPHKEEQKSSQAVLEDHISSLDHKAAPSRLEQLLDKRRLHNRAMDEKGKGLPMHSFVRGQLDKKEGVEEGIEGLGLKEKTLFDSFKTYDSHQMSSLAQKNHLELTEGIMLSVNEGRKENQVLMQPVRTMKSLQNERFLRKSSQNRDEIKPLDLPKESAAPEGEERGLKSKHSRKQSKSSVLIGTDAYLGQIEMKQQYKHMKQMSKLKGENENISAELSLIDIPSEHAKNQGLQQCQKPAKVKKAFEVRGPKIAEPKQISINRVKDSSPLKTISSCQETHFLSNKGNFEIGTSRQFKKGQFDQFLMFSNSNGQSKFESKTEQENLEVTLKSKQPKQGSKKQLLSQVPSQQSLYQTQRTSNLGVEEKKRKAAYFTCIEESPGKENKRQRSSKVNSDFICSDFVNSQEEVCDRQRSSKRQSEQFEIKRNLEGEFGSGPGGKWDGLSRSQQFQGITPRLNNVQPGNGRFHFEKETSQKRNARGAERTASGHRTQSVEKILRENAQFLDNIQHKDFIKMNRANDSSTHRKLPPQTHQPSKRREDLESQEKEGEKRSDREEGKQELFKGFSEVQQIIKEYERMGRLKQIQVYSPKTQTQNWSQKEAALLEMSSQSCTQGIKESSQQSNKSPVFQSQTIPNLARSIKKEIIKNQQTSSKKGQGSKSSIQSSQNFTKYLNNESNHTIPLEQSLNQIQEERRQSKNNSSPMTKKTERKSGVDKSCRIESNGKKGNVSERPAQPKTKTPGQGQAQTQTKIKPKAQSPRQTTGTTQTMFQQRKDSTQGRDLQKKTKVLKNSLVNENSETMKEKRKKAAAKFGGFGQRKSSEIQCIIYSKNMPADILTTQEEDFKEEEQDIIKTISPKNRERLSIIPQPLSQKAKEESVLQENSSCNQSPQELQKLVNNQANTQKDKQQAQSVLSNTNLHYSSSSPYSIENGLQEKQSIQKIPFQIASTNTSQERNIIHETFIKAKLSNLLKETRTQFQEIEPPKEYSRSILSPPNRVLISSEKKRAFQMMLEPNLSNIYHRSDLELDSTVEEALLNQQVELMEERSKKGKDKENCHRVEKERPESKNKCRKGKKNNDKKNEGKGVVYPNTQRENQAYKLFQTAGLDPQNANNGYPEMTRQNSHYYLQKNYHHAMQLPDLNQVPSKPHFHQPLAPSYPNNIMMHYIQSAQQVQECPVHCKCSYGQSQASSTLSSSYQNMLNSQLPLHFPYQQPYLEQPYQGGYQGQYRNIMQMQGASTPMCMYPQGEMFAQVPAQNANYSSNHSNQTFVPHPYMHPSQMTPQMMQQMQMNMYGQGQQLIQMVPQSSIMHGSQGVYPYNPNFLQVPNMSRMNMVNQTQQEMELRGSVDGCTGEGKGNKKKKQK